MGRIGTEAAALHSAIRVDAGGVVRVGPGRVSLDLIAAEYESGATPEEMVRAYDALRLADVYEALCFLHRHGKRLRRT
jgi:uncharacterized protein (DUF433 family)